MSDRGDAHHNPGDMGGLREKLQRRRCDDPERPFRAEEEARNRAQGTLVQDPETGEYHLRDD